MKKLLLAAAFLCTFSRAYAVVPLYNGVSTPTISGTVTRYLSGTDCVAASSASAGTCTISLAGPTGKVTATSFAGDGSLLTNVPAATTSTTTISVSTLIVNSQFIDRGTATIAGNAFSVGGSSFVISGGAAGFGTASPAAMLQIKSPATTQANPLFRVTSSNGSSGVVTLLDLVDYDNVGDATAVINGYATGVPILSLHDFSSVTGTATVTLGDRGVRGLVYAEDNGDDTAMVRMRRYTTDNLTTTFPTFSGERGRGSIDLPTKVLSGDWLAYFGGTGYAASTGFYASNAAMVMLAGEDFNDSTHVGADIAFYNTTNAGGSSRSERMRISNSGNVGIGTSSPIAKLDVAGTQVFGSGTGTTMRSTVTANGYWKAPTYTTAQLAINGSAPAPGFIGVQVWNSSINDICVSTGTAASQWALMGSKGSGGCY